MGGRWYSCAAGMIWQQPYQNPSTTIKPGETAPDGMIGDSFSPYFYDWSGLYAEGMIDASE
jgi:hypothetical protein